MKLERIEVQRSNQSEYKNNNLDNKEESHIIIRTEK